VVGGDAVERARAQRLDQRLAVVLGAQRRVHLEVGVERAHGVVGQAEVVRRDLRAELDALGLGALDRDHRLPRRDVLDVDPAALVAGDGGIARDGGRLGDRRDPAEAEQRGHGALVHRAVP
jgi:hypothetical protein